MTASDEANSTAVFSYPQSDEDIRAQRHVLEWADWRGECCWNCDLNGRRRSNGGALIRFVLCVACVIIAAEVEGKLEASHQQ